MFKVVIGVIQGFYEECFIGSHRQRMKNILILLCALHALDALGSGTTDDMITGNASQEVIPTTTFNKAFIKITKKTPGHRKLVRRLVKRYGPNFTDPETSDTLLTRIARFGSAEDAKLLCETGINVNAQDSLAHEPPLWWAIFNPHHNIIPVLVAHKADLHWQDDQGMDALMWAVVGGQLIAVQQLLRAGASVHVTDKKGNTALQQFIGLPSDHRIAQLLLERGADANVQNHNRETPLQHAYQILNSAKLIRVLRAHGAT